MPSAVTFLGHPLHPALIVFPLGLLLFSAVGDALTAWTRDRFWYRFTYYVILGGIAGGVAAAVPGLIDYFLAIPEGSELQRFAQIHLWLNVSALLLFTGNLLLRRGEAAFEGWRRKVTYGLTAAGVGILLVSGWYGGHMVYEHRMGVAVEEHEHEENGEAEAGAHPEEEAH